MLNNGRTFINSIQKEDWTSEAFPIHLKKTLTLGTQFKSQFYKTILDINIWLLAFGGRMSNQRVLPRDR